MNYYSRHIGDYLRDAAHLSLLEHGIYARLMDVYYTKEAPLPKQGVGRLIGIRTDEELDALMLVLGEFFVDDGDSYRQPRCDEEIAKYREKAERNREVGKLGGRPKKPTDNPDGLQTEPNHNPPNSQEPIAKKEREARATRLPSPFVLEEAWREWARGERPDLNLDRTAANFADHWHAKPGKDGRKLDWLATWRTWVRNERMNPADVARVTVPGPKPSNFLAEQAAHRAAVEAERQARKQAA